jgi:hypothetical protein
MDPFKEDESDYSFPVPTHVFRSGGSEARFGYGGSADLPVVPHPTLDFCFDNLPKDKETRFALAQRASSMAHHGSANLTDEEYWERTHPYRRFFAEEGTTRRGENMFLVQSKLDLDHRKLNQGPSSPAHGVAGPLAPLPAAAEAAPVAVVEAAPVAVVEAAPVAVVEAAPVLAGIELASYLISQFSL